MREKLSDGFCVLPFYGMEYPSKVHCCLLKEGYDITQIRKEMLENKKHKDCTTCWNLES